MTLEQKTHSFCITSSEPQIPIIVMIAGLPSKKIKVSPSAKISILQEKFHPSSHLIFIFKGRILTPDWTFAEAQIDKHDRLIALPNDRLDAKSESFWRTVSQRSIQSFSDSLETRLRVSKLITFSFIVFLHICG
jgi:hypothetical protein